MEKEIQKAQEAAIFLNKTIEFCKNKFGFYFYINILIKFIRGRKYL